jgi:hypothetical protein
MKTLFLLCLALAFAGCASTPGVSPGLINQVLDSTLPATFTGPASIRHRNPYVTLVIEADGLKRGPMGWEWRWLTYKREGRVSEGTITLGAK